MAAITVLGGDFLRGTTGTLSLVALTLPTVEKPDPGETIPLADIAAVQLVPPTSWRRPRRSGLLGLMGGLVAGPVGALAGLWAGGVKKEVTFQITFKDGRMLLAAAGFTAYLRLLTANS